MSNQHPASSPLATGGAGTFFEQHVCAQFLALLLVRAIPPIIKDCQVQEVHFQAEHLGWNTDDLLIVASRGAGGHRKLASQVKRQFTISDKDPECKKAFIDFWKDFRNTTLFDRTYDRLALIVLRGTDTLLGAFNALLDGARGSIDGADFFRKLHVEGLWSKKARVHAETIKTILTEHDGQTPTDEEFWRFLTVLHVISLDLNTPSAQNEAWTKTLLAHTCNAADPFASAEATWRELLELVGSPSTGMPSAASFKYENLPESLRQRHTTLPSTDTTALKTLAAHSEVTLEGIHTTIAGSVTIKREEQVARILETLDQSQVVVVTGPAGAGKSVLAKTAVELLRKDYFCVAFRAEEFASGHIDTALQQAHAALTAERLFSILAAQGRKLILVESIERLLEATVRDAFSDLLRIAKRDKSIQILLTCRDYSVDTVRVSLLEQNGLAFQTVEVLRLTDDELAHVVEAITPLSTAVQDANLKELLRSPYLLDKATRVNWLRTEPLPSSEQEFRTRCWSEVVRSNAHTAQGMPQRREQVFVEIALRRARELRPYVICNDLDQDALDALRKDDLINVSNDNPNLAAPAHDVLEDWAIIHWLTGQFALHEAQASDFANDISGYPAIRRGYRKWLSEILERDPEVADSFVRSTLEDITLPASFRDDTIVCTLLAASAPSFLERNRAHLIANDYLLLTRVIHLLRIACKTLPSWLSDIPGLPSQLLEPSGNAWSPVLQIVSDEIDNLLPQHMGIVLGLVDDWSQWVSFDKPEPPGFEEAGRIAYSLLVMAGGYRDKDRRKQVLSIIAKIPKADTDAFLQLVERATASNNRDTIAEEFAEILLTETNSYACREFPDQIIKLIKTRCCLSEQDLHKHRRDYSFIDIEPHFGIREHTNQDFLPASALQGPYFPLLRSHPRLGVQFIIELLNHVCTWYGEQKWPGDRLEPAVQIVIDIPSHGERTVWANWRLYGLYRGATVGPYLVQSALMALEHWFLELAKWETFDLEAWLLHVLAESNNVAIAAVVASICNAFPEKCGRAGLALLTSQEIIVLDRSRMVSDLSPSIANYMPSLSGKQYLDEERKKADSLPHRKLDLEALAVQLQFTDVRAQVWEILDRHKSALPPVEQQSEEHKVWRLALHRMDIRGFKIDKEVPRSEVTQDALEDQTGGQNYYLIGPGEIEPDVQEMVEQNASEFAQVNADLVLRNWGHSAWDRKQQAGQDLSAWREMLAVAKKRAPAGQSNDVHTERDGARSFAYGGPILIAAVCVRDHWEKMSPEDQQWCSEKLIAEVDFDVDTDNDITRHSAGGLFPDRHAAFVLPKLLSTSTSEADSKRIIEAIAKALTHSVEEVAVYAAEGIGFFLHSSQTEFALQCIGALCGQVRLIEKKRVADSRKAYDKRLSGSQLVQSTVKETRRRIVAGGVDVQRELNELGFRGWSAHIVVRSILRILQYFAVSDVAVQFHTRVAEYLLDTWNKDKQNYRHSDSRDYDFESFCMECIAKYALTQKRTESLLICAPLLDAVDEHPREVEKFIKDLIYADDRFEEQSSFWHIWQAFSDRLYSAPWITNIDSNYGDGTSVVRALFLGVEWNEAVRHWRRLEGHGQRIDALFNQLPIGSTTFEAYCRFLYRIGEKSLPNAFVVVADRLKDGNGNIILSSKNSVVYLESLLRRYVYGEPLRLKANPKYRRAVLYLLDQLVEAGSSAAYRMRDDFVTPMSQRG